MSGRLRSLALTAAGCGAAVLALSAAAALPASLPAPLPTLTFSPTSTSTSTSIMVLDPTPPDATIAVDGPLLTGPGAGFALTGSGWHDESAVNLSLTDSGGDPAQSLASVPDPSGDGGDFTVNLTAPDLPGTYTVHACQDCNDEDPGPSATTTLTVQQPLLDPEVDQRTPGGQVTVTGPWWLPGVPVEVFADESDSLGGGTPLAEPRDATTEGSFYETLTAPGDPGSYLLFACQYCATGRQLSATSAFTVLPPVQSAPVQSTPVHSTLSSTPVRSTSSSTPVQSTLSSTPVRSTSSSTPVQSTSSSTPVMPSSIAPPRGGLTTAPARSSSGAATVIMTPPPTAILGLAPATVGPGGSVTARGAGWLAGLPVTIVVDAGPGDVGAATPGKPLASTSGVSAVGTFGVRLRAPTRLGSYPLVACQECGGGVGFRTAGAVLTVRNLAGKQTVRLTPDQSRPGSAVRVSGSNWSPGAPVSVYADAAALADHRSPLATSSAASLSGAFAVSFRAPTGTGPRTLVACQSCSGGAGFRVATVAFLVLPVAGSARHVLRWVLIVTIVLVAGAALILAPRRLRRGRHELHPRPQVPHFRPRPDLTLDVQVGPAPNPSLPTVRLVVRDGSLRASTPEAGR